MSPALCMLSPVGFRGGDILQRAPVRMLTPATRISGIVLRVRNPIQVVTINGGARTVDSSSCSSFNLVNT